MSCWILNKFFRFSFLLNIMQSEYLVLMFGSLGTRRSLYHYSAWSLCINSGLSSSTSTDVHLKNQMGKIIEICRHFMHKMFPFSMSMWKHYLLKILANINQSPKRYNRETIEQIVELEAEMKLQGFFLVFHTLLLKFTSNAPSLSIVFSNKLIIHPSQWEDPNGNCEDTDRHYD